MNCRGSIKQLLLLSALSLNVPALAAEPVSHMIEVNGATLEYLDWGGSGPPTNQRGQRCFESKGSEVFDH